MPTNLGAAKFKPKRGPFKAGKPSGPQPASMPDTKGVAKTIYKRMGGEHPADADEADILNPQTDLLPMGHEGPAEQPGGQLPLNPTRSRAGSVKRGLKRGSRDTLSAKNQADALEGPGNG